MQEINLLKDIKLYEDQVFESYWQLDINYWLKKGKSKFSDLTLQDNLQYIKQDITSPNDALSLFEETKDTFPGPEISA